MLKGKFWQTDRTYLKANQKCADLCAGKYCQSNLFSFLY